MAVPYKIPAPSTIRSRMLGSLYGLSVGDALGGPYQFEHRGCYTPSGEMEEGRTWNTKDITDDQKPLPKGSWMDDTSLALCLAESLRENNGFVWTDVADKWCAWKDDAPSGYMSVIGEYFEIGSTTRQGLLEYTYRKSLSQPLPATAPRVNDQVHMVTNGPIMRIAPVPVFFWNPSTPSELYDAAAQSSYITHGAAACVDGCVLMSAFIVAFLRAPEERGVKEKKEKILNKDFRLEGYLAASSDSAASAPLSERLTSTKMRPVRVEKTYKTKTVDEIRCSGSAVHTLEAALWSLWHTETYEEGLLKLLPLGEDVDTVGAVYGSMAGACYGLETIPQRWLNDLNKKEVLDEVYGGLEDQFLGME
ncbi:hypothetical protein FS837_009829 [Tulasnella sp. UAMH 9824]|nr:hypothetical protein FS837_009829 [Tulasnella sp. UAMH 9824]